MDLVGRYVQKVFLGYGHEPWTGRIVEYDGKKWKIEWHDGSSTAWRSKQKVLRHLKTDDLDKQTKKSAPGSPTASGNKSKQRRTIAHPGLRRVESQLSGERLQKLLFGEGLDSCLETFRMMDFSAAQLIHLTDDDLKALGIDVDEACRFRFLIERMLLNAVPAVKDRFSIHCTDTGEVYFYDVEARKSTWARSEEVTAALQASGLTFEDASRSLDEQRSESVAISDSEDEAIPLSEFRLNPEGAKEGSGSLNSPAKPLNDDQNERNQHLSDSEDDVPLAEFKSRKRLRSMTLHSHQTRQMTQRMKLCPNTELERAKKPKTKPKTNKKKKTGPWVCSRCTFINEKAHFLCCEACGSPKTSSALLKNKPNPRVEAAGQDQSSAGTDGDGGADPEQLDEWRKGKRCKVKLKGSWWKGTVTSVMKETREVSVKLDRALTEMKLPTHVIHGLSPEKGTSSSRESLECTPASSHVGTARTKPRSLNL